MTCVSWNDASRFCNWLSEKEQQAYRLPTEAEWEYACRASLEPSSVTHFHYGGDAEELGNFAWIRDNSKMQTNAVGQKRPNRWGIHEMHGHIWEWCVDWYQVNFEDAPVDDPQGPSNGYGRVLRGGSWYSSPRSARTSIRDKLDSNGKSTNVGFRIVRDTNV